MVFYSINLGLALICRSLFSGLWSRDSEARHQRDAAERPHPPASEGR